MQRFRNINQKRFFIRIFVLVLIFSADRFTKMYLLNLSESGVDIDFYITPFLNFYLVWNTGVGFGLFSYESNIFYHFITFVIGIINVVIILLIIKLKDVRNFFLLMILGGSLGNLFDRLYYYAVPDFVDFHIGDFHWFIFNVADVFITIGVLCLIFVEIFVKSINK